MVSEVSVPYNMSFPAVPSILSANATTTVAIESIVTPAASDSSKIVITVASIVTVYCDIENEDCPFKRFKNAASYNSSGCTSVISQSV